VTGIAAAGMGLKGFLLSSNFIDGGVTGVSMLLSKTTVVPLAAWLPLVNLPFIRWPTGSWAGVCGTERAGHRGWLCRSLVFVPYS
jgi:hypothetical protein